MTGERLTSRWRGNSSAALISALVVGCGAGGRPEPLYPVDGERPAPEQVASLHGDVKYVDGEDVATRGPPFELMPGCHVVGTPETWGRGFGEGAVMAKLPKVVFAIPMRAGYRYVVRIDARFLGGPTGNLSIVASEENAAGETTSRFNPANPEGDPCAGVHSPDWVGE